MNGTETHGYRVVCKHGKVRAMTVDDSMTTQHCLKDLREFRRWAERAGATIDHVTIEDCRKSDMDCPDCDKEKRSKKREAA